MIPTSTLKGSSTAAAALALGLLIIPPTLNTASGNSLVRTPVRNATALPFSERRVAGTMPTATTISPDFAPVGHLLFGDTSDRATSQVEKIVGEFRRWVGLLADWDGEGAVAPNALSLESASDFIRLLPEALADAEPMLNANGRAGLYWNEGGLYADLEFLGDERIAYFIQRHEDKHKGVTRFNGELVPPVLSILLEAPRAS